ncbi:MAG: acyltransferase family protein [Actinomycetaceae bacterium]|nr:acyltransferase family protein [Actinomycetaceae bacterium]
MAQKTRESGDLPASSRLEWLDIAKGIAIFLVVVGHTVDHGTVRQLIFSFHMPAFFILAGFTLRAKPWKTVLQSSAKRLLLPYILIVAIAVLPNVLTSDAPISSRFLALAQALVFPAGYPSTQWMPQSMWAGVRLDYVGGGFYGVGMAWFLWCLFLARILANALLRIAAKWKQDNNPWIIAGTGVLMLALAFVVPQKLLVYLPFDFDLALLAVGFMFFGQLIKVLNAVRLKLVFVGVVAFILWIIATRYSTFEMSSRAWGDNYLLAICGALAGTLALCYISLGIEALRTVPILRYAEKAVAWTGRHSLEIYAMHAIDGRLLMLSAISVAPIADSWIAKSLLRFGYDLLLVALVRKISK